MRALWILVLCLMVTACSGADYTLEETFGPAHVVCKIDGQVVYEGVVNGLLDALNDQLFKSKSEIAQATANCVVTLDVE